MDVSPVAGFGFADVLLALVAPLVAWAIVIAGLAQMVRDRRRKDIDERSRLDLAGCTYVACGADRCWSDQQTSLSDRR